MSKHILHNHKRTKKDAEGMPVHLKTNEGKDNNSFNRDPAYYDEDEIELLEAVDKFRTDNRGVYVSVTMVMKIMKELGWRKCRRR